MKNFFDPACRQELLERLEKLTPATQPGWGKMTAPQMLAHLTAALNTPTGEQVLKPMPFFLRLLGRMIKKSVLSEKPYSKNSPTAKEYFIKDPWDFDTEKQNFLTAFHKLAAGKQAVKVPGHSFFGPMTPDEWGRHTYKHTDHHFRQFGI